MNLLAQANLWSGVHVGEQLFLFAPMIVLVCTMLAIEACPIFLGRSPRTVVTVVALGVFVALVFAFRVAGRVSGGGMSGLSTDPAAGLLVVDNLSAGFEIILLVFVAAVTYLWWLGSAESERNSPEFFVLLLGSAFGMMMMASAANLLTIVIAIEAASLPSYAIVGFNKRNRMGAEASLKYMIFGAVSAAIMLYGASLIYGLAGSLSLTDVAAYTAEHLGAGDQRILLGVALFCLLAGIAFKISAVPFHFWCPDAFEGAQIEVTTWLSVASKAAGLVLLARVVMTFCHAVEHQVSMQVLEPLSWTIGIMAAVTCTVGNFAAYLQTSVKRLLAYSSIAHAGYMMMALAVFVHPSARGYGDGLTALLMYILIYLFMNLGAFGVTAFVAWDRGSDDIDAFTGLMRRAPGLAIPMIFCLMSLVGLPPLAGFIGKWWILWALGDFGSAGHVLGWILIIVAVLNTLISLYFYLRIVVKMALRDEGAGPVHAPLGGLALVNLCGIALLVLTFAAYPLRNAADRFTAHLFDGTTGAATTAVTQATGDK